MKRLNLEDLSEESAHEVIAVLDLVSGSDDSTLVLRGNQAIYQLSKVTSDVEGADVAEEDSPRPGESFSDTLERILDGPPLLEDKYLEGDENMLRRDAWAGRGVDK